nr:VP3 [rabbit kobuvirus]
GFPVTTTIGSGQFITTVRDNGIPIYPEFQADICHDIPGEYKNFLEVARVGTFMKLSQNLLGVSITPSFTAGQKVFGFPIDFDNDAFRPTYVALLSKFYINWRGSLKLTLTFAGAAMCTAKLVVCYTPPGTQEPADREEAMLGTSLIWDVGLQSSCTLVIPWISETQFRLTTGQTRASATGFVTCWMQTRLVNPPSLPGGTSIFATLSAGDDFCFRIPSDSGYFQ